MVVRSCWKSRHKNILFWSGAGPLLLLLVLFVSRGGGVPPGTGGASKRVVQKDAEFDVVYGDTVTSENQTIYAFNHTVSRNKVSVGGLGIPPAERAWAASSPHLRPFRRRGCVCLWTCFPRASRVPSCSWSGRSRLCFPSRFLSFCEACEYKRGLFVGGGGGEGCHLQWLMGCKQR